jgi:hypothetical protein
MLYYEITGYGSRKKLCEDILIWFIKKYYPRHKIEIFVNHRGLKREHAVGFCDVLYRTYRPRSFLIEIQSNLEEYLYALTLIHELIHIKQWIDGSLKLKQGSRFYKGINVELMDYFSQPHEIEAHQKEEKYLTDFVRESGHLCIE